MSKEFEAALDAIINSKPDKLSELIKKRPKILSESHKETLLHCAMKSNSRQCLEHIVEGLIKQKQFAAIALKENYRGETPLHVSAAESKSTKLPYLLSQLQQEGLLNQTLAKVNNAGFTPLQVAAMSRSPQVFDIFLQFSRSAGEEKSIPTPPPKRGFLQNLLSRKPKKSTTPNIIPEIINAIINNDTTNLGRLLEKNPGVLQHSIKPKNCTVMQLAVDLHKPDCLAVMLKQPAVDVTKLEQANDQGKAKLHLAIAKTDTNQVRDLLLQKDAQGKTQLHLAIEQGDKSYVRFLLEEAQKHNLLHEIYTTTDNAGLNPLLTAASMRATDISRLLIDFSPNQLLQKDAQGKTQLHLAIEKDDKSYVQLLLEKARKYNLVHEIYTATDNGGFNPLHTAAFMISRDNIKLLIDFSREEALHACRMVSNNGNIPLRLYVNAVPYDQNDSILKLLEDRTLSYDFKPLSAKIDVSEVLQTFPGLQGQDQALQKTIDNIAATINKTRKQITSSDSHPDARWITDEDFEKRRQKIKQMRTKENHRYSMSDVNLIQQTHAGNCGEFATVFANEFIALDPNAAVDIQQFASDHGDHVWNEVRVQNKSFFVDAWSGMFAPADERHKYLMDFQYHRSGNYPHAMPVITYLNPAFHAFVVTKTLGPVVAAPNTASSSASSSTTPNSASSSASIPSTPTSVSSNASISATNNNANSNTSIPGTPISTSSNASISATSNNSNSNTPNTPRSSSRSEIYTKSGTIRTSTSTTKSAILDMDTAAAVSDQEPSPKPRLR